ncbi:hypothetical protein Hokovirus_1_23 [Hokovirus HKV1]|uniref:Uncharacterized protein n=1 Tax=Hokovirus HKV1 TaxID=1977638 RepID=A0A1V0SEU0_9VIRU|nr:hypothetical protein Hokovirus_1_23 [Hokovirus HKV1]
MTFKAKKVDIKINNKLVSSKSSWVSLSNGLVYISWDTDRTYFFIDKNKKIKESFVFDDDNNVFKFTYFGPWEYKTTYKKNVKKNFKISFLKKDYVKFKKLVSKF